MREEYYKMYSRYVTGNITTQEWYTYCTETLYQIIVEHKEVSQRPKVVT